MAPSLRALALIACLGAGALPACSKEPEAPSEGGASPSAAEDKPITVTHILIAYKSERMQSAKRTKDEALRLAKSVLDDVVSGRRTMEEMVRTMSDDRPDNPTAPERPKPHHDGVYTFMAGDGLVLPVKPDRYGGTSRVMEEFRKAAVETPVGKVYPTPVEVPYGYHLIRRDR